MNMCYRINELDVWYNKDEGYFINDIFKTDNRIFIDNPYDVREVLKKTREFYNLPNGRYTTNVNDNCNSMLFEIVKRNTQEPVLQLELCY